MWTDSGSLADLRAAEDSFRERTLNGVACEDMEIKPTKVSYRRKVSPLEKKLYLVAVLLLVICLILLIVITVLATRQTGQVHGESEVVCMTQDCVLVAADILQTIDQNVDPCDDFFLHACGGWINNNPIPPNEPRWNQVLILKTKNDQLLKTLLGDNKVRQEYRENDAVQKAFLYYDSCTDYGLIELAKGKPLLEVIAKYGSWNATGANWTKDSWDFMKTLVDMHKDLKLSPLFSLQVQPDLTDSSRYIIMLDQTSHTITRDAYLRNSSYHLQVRAAYQRLMMQLVKLLGGDQASGSSLMEVFEFEKKLAQISATADDRADRSKMYRPMSIKELQKHTGGKIDWLYFLKETSKDVTNDITEDERVAVFALEYLTNLSNLTSRTSDRVLANYMMWQAVVQLAPYLSNEFRGAFHDFRKVVMGRSGETNVWQKCLTEMSRYDNEIGDPLGVVFLDKKFDKRDKDAIISMINDLRDTFIANLDNLDWMDDKTREYAKKKAMAIRQNIGYPEYIKDPNKLTERFKDLQVTNGSYFRNVVNNRAFSMKTMLRSLREPVDKGRWMIHPHTVNAFYDRVTNKIIFPAGILQIPFYNRNFPRAISYGGIGIVVAHEITHGFDSNGRKYDENGDLVNWWTNSSNQAFEKKSKCFEEQYSSFEAYGTKLNGIQTLGENIADNGAIKQGFMAYKEWVRKHGEEPRLPGLNYTNEQLFFIGSAQVDCGSILKPVALDKIEQATHTLNHWRVIGEMSNSKEFAKAFNCPVGSRMNPRKKCAIW